VRSFDIWSNLSFGAISDKEIWFIDIDFCRLVMIAYFYLFLLMGWGRVREGAERATPPRISRHAKTATSPLAVDVSRAYFYLSGGASDRAIITSRQKSMSINQISLSEIAPKLRLLQISPTSIDKCKMFPGVIQLRGRGGRGKEGGGME